MAVTIKNPLTIVKAAGGGGYNPDPGVAKDPQKVYEAERPSDWLKMPEIGASEDNVIYLLLHRGATATTNFPFSFYSATTSGQAVKYEFGTVTNGAFVPDDTLTETKTGNVNIDKLIPASAFGNATADGHVQLIIKISSEYNLTMARFRYSYSNNGPSQTALVEFSGKATQITSVLRENGQDPYRFTKLRFFKLQGTNQITSMSRLFQNCYNLRAVLDLDTSHTTNLSYVFSSCNSLAAIPAINTSSASNLSSAFYGCRSLTAVPSLNLNAATTVEQMFSNCEALVAPPTLSNTGSVTNWGQLFNYCRALKQAPTLDTSAGTVFSSMFRDNYALLNETGVIDFRGYDFSSNTSEYGPNLTAVAGPGTFYLPDADKWPATGIPRYFQFAFAAVNNADYAINIVISDGTTMIPLQTSATTTFGSGSSYAYICVYVPDALLATYQADTNWATLGTRLKAISEL